MDQRRRPFPAGAAATRGADLPLLQPQNRQTVDSASPVETRGTSRGTARTRSLSPGRRSQNPDSVAPPPPRKPLPPHDTPSTQLPLPPKTPPTSSLAPRHKAPAQMMFPPGALVTGRIHD